MAHLRTLAFMRTLLTCGSVLFFAACGEEKKPEGRAPAGREGFDSSRAVYRLISGDRALQKVISVVSWGVRPAGSEQLEKCRGYLETELKKSGWETARQEFEAETPVGRVKFANVRARFPVAGSETWNRTVTVLLGGHYDTKLFQDFSFVGANDGGSSTGVLLEIAHAAGQRPEFARRVELVFFDGEEAFDRYNQETQESMPKDGLYGSMHYARELLKLPQEQRPTYAVILDMIGEANLKINVPSNTDREMNQMLLAAAEELGVTQNIGLSRGIITDDHLPLGVGNPAAGFANLRVTNLIDLEYPSWHTKDDTLDKLSARSLEIAGQLAVLLTEKYLLRP